MRRWFFLMSASSIAIACGLNPQPLPPEDTAATTDGGMSDASGPLPRADSGSSADGSLAGDASEDVNVRDASDGGDASHDADTDGG